MSPSVPAKKGKKKNEGLTSPLSSSSQLSSLTSSALALQVQQNGQFASFRGPIGIVSSLLVDNTDLQKQPNAAVPLLPDGSNPEATINEDTLEQTILLRRQEREAELIATKLGVVSETGQGLRCSIPSCGKLFRKQKLLRQHVKHYHPNQYISVIGSSSFNDYLDHENDMLKEPKSIKISPHSMNIIMENKKRKLYPQQFELSHENNKKLKRKRSQHSADEYDLEIDYPNSLSHMPSPMNTMPRNRHDSILSASSGFSDGDFFGDRLMYQPLESTGSGSLPKQRNKLNPPTPPTPLTFRFSKRRQAQLRANRRNDSKTSLREQSELGSPRAKRTLDESIVGTSMSPKVALTPLDESMLNSPALTLNDKQQLLSSVTGGTQAPTSLVTASAPGQSSYPPSEMDVLSVTGSEHLTTEELVNCSCRRLEEDGLMIQCDICLCWQHGSCLAIEEEDQVPEYYICDTCRHPRLGRISAQYSIDQDWLNKGILPTVISSSFPQKKESTQQMSTGINQSSFATASPKQPLMDKETAFRKLSELMADLSNMSKLLHSLRVKLHIASQSNNSKVFMWSSLWDSPASSTVSHQKPEDVSVANFDDQQLFNTGGILTSMAETEVNLTNDNLDANLSLIQPSSINELQSVSRQLDPQQLTNKLDLPLSSPNTEVKPETVSLQPSSSQNAANENSIKEGQVLPISAINATTLNNGCQSTEEKGGCASSSTYRHQINTPLSEAQIESPLVGTDKKVDGHSVSSLNDGELSSNASNDQENQQSSISNCAQIDNPLSSLLSSPNAPSLANLENDSLNHVQNSNKFSDNACNIANTGESKTKKSPVVDFQRNGINSGQEKHPVHVSEKPNEEIGHFRSILQVLLYTIMMKSMATVAYC